MRLDILTRSTRAISATLLFLTLTFGLLGSAPRALTAEAHTPPTSTARAVDLAAKSNTSKKCANKARKQAKKNKKYKYWVCVGNKVNYLKKKKPRPSSASVQNDARTDRSAAQPTGKARALDIDPQDSMCELVPECTNIKTLYRADIKGNAFYGYGSEIWGAFDVIYTQHFNGASSNYNLKLFWDSGYAIDSNYWTAQVRREIKGVPDPTTGSVYFYPNRIASNAWRAEEPGRGRFSATGRTPFTGRHHDDLYGSFVAHGQVFGTTTIHLPDFHCPRHLCKYYGPTGPV